MDMDVSTIATSVQTRGGRNAREEIIALLRGQIACPLISTLGELGWLDTMAAGTFGHNSFPGPVDAGVFQAVMAYLAALQLVEGHGNDTGFRMTPLGRRVFKRYGTFCILNSYESYMRSLAALLIPDGSARPEVNRARNVIGSGAIHSRKFFEDAFQMLGDESYQMIVDVGCGDGKFLSGCMRIFPAAKLLAVDLSSTAVDQTMHRILHEEPARQIEGVVANGADISAWASGIDRAAESGARTLISCWFLIHEISRGEVGIVADYFAQLRRRCPRARVLVGEVVRLTQETLALNREGSVLPELTLLHDLSRQGLLQWDQWQQVAAEIPYARRAQRQFDVVQTETGASVPSSFIWYLEPR
jgi:Methyltransferase domain